MRIASLALIGLTFLFGCEQQSRDIKEDSGISTHLTEVSASDALSDLAAPTTGIAFWTHPAVAFNSMVIVASQDGVASYNIEDGSEVSRIPAVNAQGAAVSYLGLGPQALGLLTFFDIDASAFKFHVIDNASRSFQPAAGETPVRGALRGFCFGRASSEQNPTLYVLQKGEMTNYAIEIENQTLTASTGIVQSVPDDAQSCAVDNEDGSVLVARSNGEIHRVKHDGTEKLIANTGLANIADIAVLLAKDVEADLQSVNGLITALDQDTSGLHLFNREDGRLIGAVKVMAEVADSEYGEMAPIKTADVMSAASANLGGLYRNGVLALAVNNSDNVLSPVIHMIPVNALKNRLELPEGESFNPRGKPAEPKEDGLLIDIEFQRD